MARNRLSDEDQAFVDGVVEASVTLAGFTGDVATEYVALDPAAGPLDDDGRRLAGDLVERIATGWRAAERAGATHPQAIAELSSAGPIELIGALEDSLVLALAEPAAASELLLTADETIDRARRLAGVPPADEPAGKADTHSPPSPDPVTELFGALADGAAFFSGLRDGGDVLGVDGERRARALLTRFAAVGRWVDRDRDAVAAAGESIAPLEYVLRSMDQGLVLRLSSDPDRRDQALPIADVAVQAAMVRDSLAEGS
jgi:hypothetical protein